MKETQIKDARNCNSSNIGIGYQLEAAGCLQTGAYRHGARCSEINVFLQNCGSVLLQKVKRPEIFEAAGTARGEELWSI